jgi:hypothetical protein
METAPDMNVSWEYIEGAVTDSLHWEVLELDVERWDTNSSPYKSQHVATLDFCITSLEQHMRWKIYKTFEKSGSLKTV